MTAPDWCFSHGTVVPTAEGECPKCISPERHPIGPWGCPIVQGSCPACGFKTLFLGDGGYVTCSNLACLNPTQVSDSLVSPRAMWRVVAADPETAEVQHNGSTETYSGACDMAKLLDGRGWLVQVIDPNGKVAHSYPARALGVEG